MNPELSDLVSAGLEISRLVIVGVIAAWGMAFKKGREHALMQTRLDSLHEKVTALEGMPARLTDMEISVRGLPTWSDINSLKTEVTSVTLSLAVLSVKLDKTVETLDQVNRHIWEGLRHTGRSND